MKKYELVYRDVKDKIISGLYPEDTRLPSKRDMAHLMCVSVNTVEIAYAKLEDEAYIESVERRGYFVAKRDYMKKYMGTISKPRPSKRSYRYDFTYGGVDQGFPFGIWKKISRQAIDDLGGDLLKRVDPMGDMSLRESIAAYLKTYRGIDCKMENILISASTEHLFQVLFCILGEDKVYGIEDPGFERWGQLFRSNNVLFKPIGLDGKGIRVQDLRDSRVDIVCSTPGHQFPTGQVMPTTRRLDILDWAKEEARWIIEDDYDGEFRYRGRPLPAMKSMDDRDRVIFMGSFANTVSPAMRISYMVMPETLVDIYHERVSYTACPVPVLTQRSLDIFIRGGYFVRHINRMRKAYKRKMDLVKDMVSNYDFLSFEGGDTGLHLLVSWDLKDLGLRADSLVEEADKKDIRLASLSRYFMGSPPREGLVLGFGSLSLEDLEGGLTILLGMFNDRKLLEK